MVKMTFFQPFIHFSKHTYTLSLLLIPHTKTFHPLFPLSPLSLSFLCLCFLPPSLMLYSLIFQVKFDPFFILYFLKTIKRSTAKTLTHTHSKTTLLNISTHLHNNSSRINQLLLLLHHHHHHHHCHYSCLLLIKINIFCVFLLFVVF